MTEIRPGTEPGPQAGPQADPDWRPELAPPLDPEVIHAMVDWAYGREPGTSARLLAGLMGPEPEAEP